MPRWQNSVLTGIFTLFVLVVIVYSFDYRWPTRMIPFIFGLVTLAMLVFQLTIENVPSWNKRFSRYTEADVFGMESRNERLTQVQNKKEESKLKPDAAKEKRVIGWLTLFLVLIYFLKFTLAIPLFLFFILWLESRRPWWQSLVITGVAWLFYYELFVILLQIRL